MLQAGTLTGAAKLLNISQPAASKLLQHAEQKLGFALFTRVLGRLQLTPEGYLLREKVEKISDDLRDLQRLTDNVRQPRNHTLRVVSTPALASCVLPGAITLLRRGFPDAPIELFTQHSREMVDSILLRETDIGLTLQNVYHPGIEQQTISTGKVMVIAPTGWWSREELKRPVELASLAGQPMIGIAMRDSLGGKLRAHIQYLNPAPSISIWVQTYQLARSLVASGHGLAMVDPFTALEGDDAEVQVRKLDPGLEIGLSFLYRKGARLLPIQRSLVEQISRVAKPILLD